MALFFAYDAYLTYDFIKKYCKNARPISKAQAPDHKLSFVRLGSKKGQQTGYVNIEQSTGSTVWGLLYRLEQDDLRYIDKFEEVPDKAKRDYIDIMTDNGSTITATTIFPKKESPLPKTSDQLNLVISGAKSNGLPQEYVRGLEKMYSEFLKA
ncbi:MAG: gamma-glutamylcyclotransferase [Dehalococcoidia bacterium]|nr:gamma-glutamylcyclotransferase [Dehalococcoidia bacterium]